MTDLSEHLNSSSNFKLKDERNKTYSAQIIVTTVKKVILRQSRSTPYVSEPDYTRSEY